MDVQPNETKKARYRHSAEWGVPVGKNKYKRAPIAGRPFFQFADCGRRYFVIAHATLDAAPVDLKSPLQ
jgi:hypothetical protein